MARAAAELVPLANVRAALAAVEIGRRGRRDRLRDRRRRVAAGCDGRVGRRRVRRRRAIVYPAAIVATDRRTAEPRERFLEFLRGTAARRIFETLQAFSPLRIRSDPCDGHLADHAGSPCMAAIATLIMLPPGLLLAWLLARRRFPGRVLVETFVSLPLVMPPVATGLILLMLLAPRGAIGGVARAARHRDRLHLEGGGAGDGGHGAAAAGAHGARGLRAGGTRATSRSRRRSARARCASS